MKLEKNVILYVGFSRILSDNKIEHLPEGVFSNNTRLERLVVDISKLTEKYLIYFKESEFSGEINIFSQ